MAIPAPVAQGGRCRLGDLLGDLLGDVLGPNRRAQRYPVPLRSVAEVSRRLVGLPAFKAGGTGDPRPAGSIPVHLRESDVTDGGRPRGSCRHDAA